VKTRVLLVLIVLFLGFAPVASPQFQGPSWDLGWEDDLEEGLVLNLDGNRWTLQHTVEFWIANDRPVDVTIDLEVDLPDDAPVEVDVDDSVTVSANENATFELRITGTDAAEVRAFAAADPFRLTLTASEASQTGSGTTREIEVDLEFPRVHKLLPSVPSPPSSFDAGTWVDVDVMLRNDGNTRDAVAAVDVEVRSCPQLEVVGVESMENTLVDPTDVNGAQPVTATVRLEASSSQQSRTCEITLSVTSEGDGTVRSTSFEVEVVAASPSDGSGGSVDVGRSDASSSDDANPLPFLGLHVVLLAFLAAAVRR
jgi:hypothetical protein